MTDSNTTSTTTPAPRGRHGSALIGAAIGAILILGWAGWAIYDKVATPAVPNVQSASPAEIIAFVANDRGLARLPKFDQDRFLTAWQKNYSGSDQQRALKKYLEGASESSRQAVREVLYEIGKRQFMENAREYRRLKSQGGDTYKFLLANISEAAAQFAWVRGNGDPSRDLSEVMSKGLGNPEDVIKLIVSDTSPEDRVVGEQYIEAIRNVREQEKKRSKPPKDATPK